MPTRRPPTNHVESPAAAQPGLEATLVAALQAAADEVPAVAARLGPRFARAEARQRTQTYLRGLLSPLARKNGWQLAEAAGDPTPYATQHLLGRADWDPDTSCARTCAPTSSRTWAMRGRCWWWTRPAL
jgi:hypothetical protein